MARFEARTVAGSGRAMVSLTGEADLSVRDELTGALLAAVTTSPVVVVDLGGLTFLDSSGVHGLITAYHAAKREHRRLYVVNAGGVVAELLNLTGIAELLGPPDSNGASPDGTAHRSTRR